MSKELIGRLVKLKDPFDAVDNLENGQKFPADQIYQIVGYESEYKRCALSYEPTDPVRRMDFDPMDGFGDELSLQHKLVFLYYNTKQLVLLPKRKLKTLPVDKALAKMRKLIK